MLGNFIYSFENSEDISHFFGVNKLIDKKLYSKNQYINTLKKINKNDINQIISKILSFENIKIVCITNKHLHLL